MVHDDLLEKDPSFLHAKSGVRVQFQVVPPKEVFFVFSKFGRKYACVMGVKALRPTLWLPSTERGHRVLRLQSPIPSRRGTQAINCNEQMQKIVLFAQKEVDLQNVTLLLGGGGQRQRKLTGATISACAVAGDCSDIRHPNNTWHIPGRFTMSIGSFFHNRKTLTTTWVPCTTGHYKSPDRFFETQVPRES